LSEPLFSDRPTAPRMDRARARSGSGGYSEKVFCADLWQPILVSVVWALSSYSARPECTGNHTTLHSWGLITRTIVKRDCRGLERLVLTMKTEIGADRIARARHTAKIGAPSGGLPRRGLVSKEPTRTNDRAVIRARLDYRARIGARSARRLGSGV